MVNQKFKLLELFNSVELGFDLIDFGSIWWIRSNLTEIRFNLIEFDQTRLEWSVDLVQVVPTWLIWFNMLEFGLVQLIRFNLIDSVRLC